MTWTFCTSGAAVVRAGAYANSNIIVSGGFLATWCDNAESVINTSTRKDWVTNYASVGANFKNILGDVCSAMIAKNIINYDMSGYTSRMEAQTMLDVLRDDIERGIKFLTDDKYKEVMV